MRRERHIAITPESVMTAKTAPAGHVCGRAIARIASAPK